MSNKLAPTTNSPQDQADDSHSVAQMFGNGEGTTDEIASPESGPGQNFNPARELSPLEVAKKNAYESQSELNNRKKLFWNVMIYTVPVFFTVSGIIIAFYVSVFTYYLTGVSEPMGTLKNQIENLVEDINEIKLDIRDLRGQNQNNNIQGQ